MKKMPLKVIFSYLILILAVLTAIVSVILVAIQDPEARGLLIAIGLGVLVMVCGVTVSAWQEEKGGYE